MKTLGSVAVIPVLVLTVALASGGFQGQPPHDKTGLIYPLVPGHGGVVPLHRAAEQPRKGAKAAFDASVRRYLAAIA